ncbi:hypothetical protein TKK_0005073 [Trichogramma kaykai]
MQCDSSDVAIGGVLTQVYEDGEYPIVYVSQVLMPVECNYNTSEKEPQRVTVPEGLESTCWSTCALDIRDFQIVHRKSKYNELPDALSRLCEKEPDVDETESADVCALNVCDVDDEAYTARIEEVLASPKRWRNLCVRNGMLYHYKYKAILELISS